MKPPGWRGSRRRGKTRTEALAKGPRAEAQITWRLHSSRPLSDEGRAMTDYNSPWKTVLERYFPAFLEFYFPAAHAGIDWSRGYALLDKELQKVARDSAMGRRWVDVLVRVTGRDGWRLGAGACRGAGSAQNGFRSADVGLQLPPVRPLCPAGGEPGGVGRTASSRVRRIRLRTLGLSNGFALPGVSLATYRARWAELDASANPFAVVTQTHLQAQETAEAVGARYGGQADAGAQSVPAGLYAAGYSGVCSGSSTGC